VPPPGGESLKDTGARVWPYYMTEILPRVLRGETVLVAAHGNSLRALVMMLDRLNREQITQGSTSPPACPWSTSSTPIPPSRPRKCSATCPRRTDSAFERS
jgi:broad specificity phosphatase PhoE